MKNSKSKSKEFADLTVKNKPKKIAGFNVNEEVLLKMKALQKILNKELNQNATYLYHIDNLYKSENNKFICSIPNGLYMHISQEVENIDNVKVFNDANSNAKYIHTPISTTNEEVKSIKSRIRQVILKYCENSLIDTTAAFKKVPTKNFPKMSDMKNYPKHVRTLYKSAIKCYKSNESFRMLDIGNPGCGKTWFAKILIKELLANSNIKSVFTIKTTDLCDINELMHDISLNEQVLFIIDEMESETGDRNNPASSYNNTTYILEFLDGYDNDHNIKFLGISNLPDKMDKALFRPGRTDMIVKHDEEKPSIELISRILKANSKYKVSDTCIKKVATRLFKEFSQLMPISFYSQSMKLFYVLNDLDEAINIMKTFYVNRSMFTYNDGFKSIEKTTSIGFKQLANKSIGKEY